MKNFSLLLLMTLLICSSFGQFGQPSLGISLVGPLTTSAFRCLKQSYPNPSVIIRAYQHSNWAAGIDNYALQTIRKANAADYGIILYVELCRGINATSQLNLVKS